MKPVRLLPFLLLAPPTFAQETKLDSLPPVVVKSSPVAGSLDVDPKTKEIRVTFSKAMKPGSWSANRLNANSFPKVNGKPRFDKDGRTWILPVSLESGKTYALWLNQANRGAFQDPQGRKAIAYLLAFRTKGKAVGIGPRPFKRELAAKSFEKLVAEMSAKYSYFAHKKIDWPAVVKKHRGGILAAKDEKEFTSKLRDMLAELKDGHVWLMGWMEFHSTHVVRVERRLNLQAMLDSLKTKKEVGRFGVVGVTKSDVPVLIVLRQSKATIKDVLAVRNFFEQHRDAKGFVFDLRLANGGREAYSAMIAGMFCAKRVVYAKHRYRSGPKPTDFGETRERILPAAAKPIDKPILCLIGPGAVSSGEGWALMMKALPKCKLIGRTTRGSTGNPAPFEIKGTNITVYFSRWVATNPNGEVIEGRGVLPDIKAEYPTQAYAKRDPLWERALEELAKTTAK